MRATAITLAITVFVAYLPLPVGGQSTWITIVSPSSDVVMSGEKGEVSVAYNTPPSDKVTRIELDVDGTIYAVKHLDEPTARGIASFLLDTTRFANGAHKVVAKVYSGDRLIGSTAGSCRMKNEPVDVIAPDISIIGLQPNQVLSGVALIEVSAQDSTTENPLVSIFVDKTLKVIKNVPPYIYSWDTTGYTDGRHSIEVCALDGMGNKSEMHSVEVIVQNSGTAVAAAVSEEQSEEPIIPIERSVSTAAARSVDPISTASREANTPITISDKPDRVNSEAQTVPEEPVEVTIEPELVISDIEPASPVVSEGEPAIIEADPAPSVTLPSIEEASEPSDDLVTAFLPTNAAASIVPTVPTEMSPAVASPRLVSTQDQSELCKLQPKAIAEQKLVRPQTPEVEPVRIAMAPKPELPAQPSLEAHRIKLKLQTTKRSGRLVTELRTVIEAAGGTIVSWDNQSKTALARLDGRDIRIRIKDGTATVGGEMVKLTTVPYINSDNRTVVGVKFLKSLLGTRLHVDAGSGECTLIRS